MSTRVLVFPWSLYLQASPTSKGEKIEVCAKGHPRVIDVASNQPPRYGYKRLILPSCSFPFKWGDETLIQYELPTLSTKTPSYGPETSEINGSLLIYLTQNNAIHRPNHGQLDELSLLVKHWISWQIHCLQELRHSEAGLKMRDGKTRRAWVNSDAVWVLSTEEDAPMALIVEILQNHELIENMMSIAKRPRKILKRVRETTRLDRVREMDSACIRNLARAPGETIAEKAGSKQEILSIIRNEEVQTQENLVSAWVFQKTHSMARIYQQHNGRHRTSSRMKGVIQKSGQLQSSYSLSDLATLDTKAKRLEMPIKPNYTLMMNPRYHSIYKAYQQIQDEEKVVDDAWEWQRRLWGQTARLIFYSWLENQSPWEKIYDSHFYLHSEGHEGQWADKPHAPGPYQLPSGNRCTLFDSWDLPKEDNSEWLSRNTLPGANVLGATGCNLAMFREPACLTLVWFLYWVQDQSQLENECEKLEADVLPSFQKDVLRYSNFQYERVNGLILVPKFRDLELGVDYHWWPKNGKINLLLLEIPFDTHKHKDSLFEAFKIVTEELFQ
jgi:hypothetical protein